MCKWRKFCCVVSVFCLLQAVIAPGVWAETSIAYGMVNEDDQIDATDALLILQHSVSLLVLTDHQQECADVNADDSIDAADALLVLQYSVNLITVFPAERPLQELQPGRYEGIDVSVHQGEIDWAAVKEAGIEFAMIRTGFGRDEPNQADRYFVANVEGAKAQGISVGCYHYSYATSVENAIKEAKFMIKLMGEYQFEYPVVLDLEDKVTQALGRETITEIAIAFTDTIREAGYYPAIYANLNWVRNYIDMSRLPNVDLWLAQWNVDEPSYDGTITMWQYTSEGSVPGIQGRVDRDICYVNYPEYIKQNGYNGYAIGRNEESN